MKYPHVLGVDITYGTNNERRPIFRVIGKNTRNKNIPLVDAFLPSQQRYVFSWLFQDALPYVLHKPSLKHTALIISDQDIHMIDALMGVLRAEDRLYGMAMFRLCKWHKVSEF